MPAERVPEVVGQLAQTYLTLRTKREKFIDTVSRLGPEAFAAALANQESDAA